MRTPVRLAAYGAGLAVAFTASLGVGSVIGSPAPTHDAPTVTTPADDRPTHGTDQEMGHSAGGDPAGH